MKPFFKLISSTEAYQRIGTLPALATETIQVLDGLGRVLAEDVAAIDDVPHFFRSNMDGYAVRAADTFAGSENHAVALRLDGHVEMGQEATEPLRPGSAIRVSTGAMMPPGADAVVMVERTEERVSTSEPGVIDVLVRANVVPSQNTVAIGEDVHAGDVILRAGHRVRGGDIGALCGVGRTSMKVYARPRAGVMATGDEIVAPDAKLKPGQVRNVNQHLLRSMSERLGNPTNDYGVVADDEAAFADALGRSAAECDAVFISGGSSMGTRDLTVASVAQLPGAEVLFHGVAIAPGKPTLLARTDTAVFLGVPGNPAAAAVVFHLFGQTVLRVLEGERLDDVLMTRPRVRARLAESVRSTPGREDYVRIKLVAADDGGPPMAHTLRAKSVAISTIARAHGLLAIPFSSEGLDEGVEIDVILL